jgi:hypothetical protein
MHAGPHLAIGSSLSELDEDFVFETQPEWDTATLNRRRKQASVIYRLGYHEPLASVLA